MASIFKSKNYDYSYPRVRLSTTALRHSNVQPAAEDTTVLFAAFASSKGPTDKIVKIHTLSEFVLTYGELDQKLYDINRQTIINICNWLNNGGTVYALRLVNPFDQPWTDATTAFNANETYFNKEDNYSEIKFDAEGTGFATGASNYFVKNITKAKYNTSKMVEGVSTPVFATAPIEAKYFGKYYESIYVSFKKVSDTTVNATVTFNDGTNYEILEQFYRLTAKNYKAAFSSSEYIGYIDLDTSGLGLFSTDGIINSAVLLTSYRLKDTSGAVIRYGDIETYDEFEDMLKHFWGVKVSEYLGNSLETPIDVVLDAGYSDALKTLLFNKLCSTGTGNVRDDIFLFLDSYHSFNKLEIPTASTYNVGNSQRLAVYDQYYTINDATFTSQDIYVSPTYFISKLLPYIDINYGIQWPMSGIRRAVLEDMKDISNNPGMAEKETLFKARINYAEKTARECAFMSQRTHDGSTEDDYTALSFINNSRTLEKIKKDLIRLGREYLFEFNDSITLSNMSNVLNKYLNNWISNRTLSHAEAIVAKNPYSDEAVDVTLVIKFTGTIEVISVDITIE